MLTCTSFLGQHTLFSIRSSEMTSGFVDKKSVGAADETAINTQSGYDFSLQGLGELMIRLNPRFPNPTIANDTYPAKPWSERFFALMHSSGFNNLFREYFNSCFVSDMQLLISSGDVARLTRSYSSGDGKISVGHFSAGLTGRSTN
jgi:hypothetical protein